MIHLKNHNKIKQQYALQERTCPLFKLVKQIYLGLVDKNST